MDGTWANRRFAHVLAKDQMMKSGQISGALRLTQKSRANCQFAQTSIKDLLNGAWANRQFAQALAKDQIMKSGQISGALRLTQNIC